MTTGLIRPVAAQTAPAAQTSPSANELAETRFAAEAGDKVGQTELGLLYLKGAGVPLDPKKGRYWLSKAAAQGYEPASRALAQLTTGGVPAASSAANSGAQQARQSAEAPTDDEVTELARNRMRDETIELIRSRYGNIDKLVSNDVLQEIQGTTPYTSRAVLACTANAPADRQRCLANLRETLRKERDHDLAEARKPGALDDLLFSFVQKTNYEGNYVAYVDMRKRGTDQKWRLKLLLKYRDGRWVVAEKSEQEVH
jgi:hypothetical protein